MSDELKQAALSYAARGWAVFPLAPNGKLPLIAKEQGGKGVHDATTERAQIESWWNKVPDANIGIAAGASGLLLVDVDAKDGRDGFTSWDVQRVTHLVDDTTPHVLTPHDGKHLYYKAPPGVELRNTVDTLGPGIETKANGTYLVAPPSRLPDGAYRWDERLNLDTVPLATFPPSLAAQIAKPAKAERKAERPVGGRAPTSDTADVIADALRHIDPWSGGYDWWVSILMAIHSELPGLDGLRLAESWADGKEDEVADKWKGFKPDGGITIGTLYAEAEQRGWFSPWHQSRTAQTHPGTDDPPGWLEANAVTDVTESPATATPPKTTNRPPTGRVRSTDLVDFLTGAGYSFRLNLCDDSIEVNGERITDVMRAQIRCRLRDAGLGKFLAAAEDALVAHAAKNSYHPVRAYLESLTWSGDGHIARLADHFKDVNQIIGLYLRKWLIGSIARAYTGTQNAVLVLDGPQGLGKSQFAHWLCPLPKLFVDANINPDDKDASLLAMRSWIWEVSELGATTKRADVEALKSFLSRETITIRPAYARFEIAKPGLASFIGTVNNSSGIFSDPTGSRRYWATTLTAIDWHYTRSVDRDQVWAEAFAAYKNGESWTLTRDEADKAREINEEYSFADPVEDLLRKHFLMDPTDRSHWISSADVLTTLQANGLGANATSNAMKISATLKRLGFDKSKRENVNGYFGLRQ